MICVYIENMRCVLLHLYGVNLGLCEFILFDMQPTVLLVVNFEPGGIRLMLLKCSSDNCYDYGRKGIIAQFLIQDIPVFKFPRI